MTQQLKLQTFQVLCHGMFNKAVMIVLLEKSHDCFSTILVTGPARDSQSGALIADRLPRRSCKTYFTTSIYATLLEEGIIQTLTGVPQLIIGKWFISPLRGNHLKNSVNNDTLHFAQTMYQYVPYDQHINQLMHLIHSEVSKKTPTCFGLL
jgi:hypothetical protein